MESLEDFNRRRRDERWAHGYVLGAAVPGGIACPKCGELLHDVSPQTMMYSDPGQMKVKCDGCGHGDLRVA